MGSHSLFQGIFPIQGLNPGLLHCRFSPFRPSSRIKASSVQLMDKCITFCQIALVSLNYFIHSYQSNPTSLYSCNMCYYPTFIFLTDWLKVVVVTQLFSRVRLFATSWMQPARLPCPSLSSQSLYKFMFIESMIPPSISSSVVPSSSCLQSFPVLGSFPTSWLFTSGSQKYWSFSFIISPCYEHSGSISFVID